MTDKLSERGVIMLAPHGTWAEFDEDVTDEVAALEQRMEGLADMLAEAEGVLDNQNFKVTKETWEDWERWKMGAMLVSEEIKEALAEEEA